MSFDNLRIETDSPLDKQGLVYDAASGVWKNSGPRFDLASAVDGQAIVYDAATGMWVPGSAGGGGTPGGADTQVQFNDGGLFGGDAGLTYDRVLNVLSPGDVAFANLHGIVFSGASTPLSVHGGDALDATTALVFEHDDAVKFLFSTPTELIVSGDANIFAIDVLDTGAFLVGAGQIAFASPAAPVDIDSADLLFYTGGASGTGDTGDISFTTGIPSGSGTRGALLIDSPGFTLSALGQALFGGALGATDISASGEVSAGDVFSSGPIITQNNFQINAASGRFRSDNEDAHVAGLAVYDVNDAIYRDFLVWTNGAAPAVAMTIPTGGTLTIEASNVKATLQTAANAVTGLTAGVLAALTNAPLVITDSSGQVYRVPCII